MGDHTTKFVGHGSGFTPSGAVTVAALMPNGDRYHDSYSKTADTHGELEWTWGWDPGDPDGTWIITFVDHGSDRTTSTTIRIVADLVSQLGVPSSDTPAGHPVVSVVPPTGDHTTLFKGQGSGFTPNASVLVSALMPSGGAYPHTYPKVADGAGRLTWSWQWDPGDADGTWTINFSDASSGKTTSIKLTIRSSSAGGRSAGHPVVSVAPPTGDHTTLFKGQGSGFTPNASVLVSALMPSGGAYPHTYPKVADGAGRLTWSWQWDPGDADGTWTINFSDASSGKTTSIKLTIRSSSAGGRSAGHPVVSVAPPTGDHTTLFKGQGSGFTPNASVLVSALMPSGGAYPHTYPKVADGAGRLTWSWQWDPGDADGTWTINFSDASSGKTTSIKLTIRS